LPGQQKWPINGAGPSVLRLGKYQSLQGPGIFFYHTGLLIISLTGIDIRVISTSFKAEKTLTKDTVPFVTPAYGTVIVGNVERVFLGSTTFQNSTASTSTGTVSLVRVFSALKDVLITRISIQ